MSKEVKYFLTPQAIGSSLNMIRGSAFSCACEEYYILVAAVFRYEVVTGKISLGLFDQGLTKEDIINWLKSLYECHSLKWDFFNDWSEKVEERMKMWGCPEYNWGYLILYHKFLEREILREDASEVIYYILKGAMEYQKWYDSEFKDGKARELGWRYDKIIRGVTYKLYKKVPWKEEYLKPAISNLSKGELKSLYEHKSVRSKIYLK